MRSEAIGVRSKLMLLMLNLLKQMISFADILEIYNWNIYCYAVILTK